MSNEAESRHTGVKDHSIGSTTRETARETSLECQLEARSNKTEMKLSPQAFELSVKAKGQNVMTFQEKFDGITRGRITAAWGYNCQSLQPNWGFSRIHPSFPRWHRWHYCKMEILSPSKPGIIKESSICVLFADTFWYFCSHKTDLLITIVFETWSCVHGFWTYGLILAVMLSTHIFKNAKYLGVGPCEIWYRHLWVKENILTVSFSRRFWNLAKI